MTKHDIAGLRAINLEDGTAEYMGSGCWVLERHEVTDRGSRRHTFAITEEDRLALLSTQSAPMVKLEDGEGHYMGGGCWVLTRNESVGLREVPQAIGVTVDGLGGLRIC